MRVLVFVLMALFAFAPALAADWGHYTNKRYGASADLPPGFVPAGPEAVNAEGLIFRKLEDHALLTIWGDDVGGGGFEAHIEKRMAFETSYSGWKIGDSSVTPDWAVFEGSAGSRRMYTRSELSCGGRQTVNIKLEYNARTNYSRIITRVANSLSAAGC